MLLHRVELRVYVWTNRTPKQFIIHAQQAISDIRQKGLEEAYKRLLKTKKECKAKLEEATLHLEFAPEGQDMTCLTQATKTTPGAYEQAKAETASVVEQVFQRYSSLIADTRLTSRE